MLNVLTLFRISCYPPIQNSNSTGLKSVLNVMLVCPPLPATSLVQFNWLKHLLFNITFDLKQNGLCYGSEFKGSVRYTQHRVLRSLRSELLTVDISKIIMTDICRSGECLDFPLLKFYRGFKFPGLVHDWIVISAEELG